MIGLKSAHAQNGAPVLTESREMLENMNIFRCSLENIQKDKDQSRNSYIPVLHNLNMVALSACMYARAFD